LDDAKWNQLIVGLREGDEDACREFWDGYGVKLQAVAQKRLSERLQRRLGPEDVVQSACRTFFRRVSSGQFDIPDSDALWRLMCAITLTKAKRAARDNTRQKRGLSQEQYLDARKPDGSPGGMELSGKGSTPFDAAEFADQMDNLLNTLEPQECQVLDLKLQSFTNAEIALQVKCSERTVRRLTDRIRTKWTELFDSEQQPDPLG